MRKILIVILSIILVSIVGCGSDNNEAKSTAKVQAKTPTPTLQTQNDISIKTIYFDAPDPDGYAHSSTEWIGKRPVVVNFWGTWCGPCRREIPDLLKLYDEYKDKGVEIIGVALNDTPDKVKNFAAQNNINYVLLVGDRAIAVKYNLRSVPTTMFIDKDGNVVEIYKGLRNYQDLKKGFDLIT